MRASSYGMAEHICKCLAKTLHCIRQLERIDKSFAIATMQCGHVLLVVDGKYANERAFAGVHICTASNIKQFLRLRNCFGQSSPLEEDLRFGTTALLHLHVSVLQIEQKLLRTSRHHCVAHISGKSVAMLL